ncbi:MAG: ABC transporter ATP-binding protein [Mycobacteriales bacterium]
MTGRTLIGPDGGDLHEEVVAVRSVVKRHEDVSALDGADLWVGRGTIHGLVGPNGAGKTTLLAILFGLSGFESGSVRVCGVDRPRVPNGVLPGVAGFLESPSFYPYLSARRNLALLAAYDGGASAGAVDEALTAVSLTDRATAKVGGFSVGMRQRLGIAAALIRSPELLILDEPGNGLDPNGVRDLHALLRRLSGDGMSILLSSHDMDEIESLAGSVTILTRGTVAFEGTMASMRASAPAPTFLLQTSNDEVAAEVMRARPGVTVRERVAAADGLQDSALLIEAERDDLDAVVIALGKAEIAVRSMQLESTALRSFFYALTERVSGASAEAA